MTYEEARKFLMNKKVFVKDKSKEVQEKLFNIGFKWLAQRVYKNRYFLFLYEDLTLTYTDEIEYFYNHEFEEISAEDILNIKVEHLPKTWEEFCENNPVSDKEACIAYNGNITTVNSRPRISVVDKNTLPSYEAAKAHRALMQLHQLRDCYRGNVDPYECQYAIVRSLSDLIVVKDITAFLSFPTRKMAKEFLSNFKDLIEEAGDLI